jgi:hypothetical protein
MSSEEMLKVAQKEIDDALEDIKRNYDKISVPDIKSRRDFVYGYEYGCILTRVANYYYYKTLGGKSGTMEEARYATDQIKALVHERLPEIRQAITRAEEKAKLKGDGHST